VTARVPRAGQSLEASAKAPEPAAPRAGARRIEGWTYRLKQTNLQVRSHKYIIERKEYEYGRVPRSQREADKRGNGESEPERVPDPARSGVRFEDRRQHTITAIAATTRTGRPARLAW
jgi:hypothetical protein